MQKKISFFFSLKTLVGLLLIGSITLSAQQSSDNTGVLGACGNPAPNPSTLHSTNGNLSPQDGSGTLGNYFSMAKCGLNFTTASLRLGQRFSPPGIGQPAPFVISGIPVSPCVVIEKAILYCDASGDGAAITATVNGPLGTANYPMTMIGSGPDKCWSYAGSYSYRADVTASVNGDATYNISGLPVGPPNDVDGATLIVVWSDGSQSFQGSIQIDDGCMIINFANGSVNYNMNYPPVCGATTNAQTFCCVGDIQMPVVSLNLNSTSAPITWDWWNYVSVATTESVGQSTSNFNLSTSSDCFNFCVVGMYWQTTTCAVCPSASSSLSVSATSTPATCSACTGTATANPTPPGSYTYSWNPSGQNTQTATNLCAGIYTVTVTGTCSTGTTTVTVGSSGTLSASSVQTNISCNGGTGSATVTPSGGLGPYSYNWSPSGGTSATATGLAAGTYNCTITDANGCTFIQSVTLTNPPVITASASSTQTSCTSNTGTATTVASGGTGALTYSWAPSGGNAATANNLAAGIYTCTITDANGCTQTATTTVTTVNGPSATLQSQVNILCNGGNNGSATVNVTGGTPGYTYAWLPSGGTGPTETGLTSGNYTCTITDAAGCTTTQSVAITQPSALAVTPSQVNPLCNGGTGTATVVASGGTPGYSYSWSPSGGTGATSSPITFGNYTCTVTDANGCITTQSFSITQPSLVSATSSQVNVMCNGGTGTGSVVASGGTPGYTYSWSPSGGTGATSTAISAGSYTCTITDANGCITTQSFTITQPPAITATTSHTNVLCNGGASGTATVTASGGTGTLTYSWAPAGGNSATANNLSAGTYTCTLTDSNGCTTTQTVTITQPLLLLANTTSDSICSGSSGSVTVAGSGGVGPYSYLWSNGSTASTQSLTVTSDTTFTVSVTDANGCTVSSSAGIFLNANPSASFTSNATNGTYQLTDGIGQLCFTNTSTGALTWVWDLNGSGSLQQSPCVSVTTADSGLFCASLVVVNTSGCIDSAETCIFIGESYYSIPNVFTPNGDGTNDGFVITNRGMKSLRCEIYNRWGELVYQWDGTTGYWDGKSKNGNDAVDGVYYYTAHLVDFSEKPIEESGFVELISGK